MAFALRFIAEEYRLGREVARRDRLSPRVSNGLGNCNRLDTQEKSLTQQRLQYFSARIRVIRSEDGRVDKIYYPAAGGPSLGWNEATDQQWNELVVILSSSTLDLLLV